MGDSDPDQNNPLSPYFPSETPTVPGNGRRWVAILLAATILGGALYGFLSALLPL
ncbi:hypothetical protein SAMN04488063_1354 [Halopelagius inordinatus]|uniref:Uncharacterized protein n=1 Tax=Halopelagius inordinatus TaxID=553467 RepID=A0A1I2NW99_9EURY|nr:hypothetical protein [Halopelagius inordinatus]SFG07823.1 hypothetical protein SAMN04488063_1354 [Halopelagius inordinatus]